jgi:nucleotide-binding universal stress UspA family protein
MNPIILATDGSPSAAEATTWAVELARETASRLFVVSVWHAGATTYPSSSTALPEKKRIAKEHACAAVSAAVEVAAAAGVDTESFVLEGDAVERICESAVDTDASLVVVGSHGFGAVRRFVSGSVSTGLVHRAPCPVLVVRPAEDGALQAAAGGA